MTDLLWLSATEAAALIRRRKLSPVEYVDAVLAHAAGLPMGVQLVGRWWSDLDLFRIGAMLETDAPWRHRRPPVP